MGFVILTIKQKNELGFITQTKNFGKLLDLGLIVNPTLAQAKNLMKSPLQAKVNGLLPRIQLTGEQTRRIDGGFSKELVDKG